MGTTLDGPELSIQEVTRVTGTTSRTLRHYDALGLLRPSRVGAGGSRWYGPTELLRLQRILVLRGLGLPLSVIGRVVDDDEDEVAALRAHLDQLRAEQQRIARQVRSVRRTITALDEGGPIMAEEMFDGFDHTVYQEEVEQRWGKKAYQESDAWWSSLSPAEQTDFQTRAKELSDAWVAASQSGQSPDSDEAQALAQQHVDWLSAIPGTPGHGSGAVDKAYLLGLADMYVADPRFAQGYNGATGATWVRDAIRTWVDRH